MLKMIKPSGIIFKTLRELANNSGQCFTVECFAEQLSLSTSCVLSAEKGNSNLSDGTIRKYCFYLNLPDEELHRLCSEVNDGILTDDEIVTKTTELYNKYNSVANTK